ncbi:MAG TPA: hypothetical protein VMB81_14925 [Candidatus Sulfotelmatobacter sp.]|nr:hypothetical protein [Candidatus Sulfotelmatobacter sp.]
MIPANQRLEHLDRPASQVDDRLELETQLAGGESRVDTRRRDRFPRRPAVIGIRRRGAGGFPARDRPDDLADLLESRRFAERRSNVEPQGISDLARGVQHTVVESAHQHDRSVVTGFVQEPQLIDPVLVAEIEVEHDPVGSSLGEARAELENRRGVLGAPAGALRDPDQQTADASLVVQYEEKRVCWLAHHHPGLAKARCRTIARAFVRRDTMPTISQRSSRSGGPVPRSFR